MIRNALALPVLLSLVACASAGPWGHAPDYAPIKGESEMVDAARDYDPVMARRTPEEWTKVPVRLFGVVLKGKQGTGDVSKLEVSVRRLAPRNLCTSADGESCRVTVSDRDFGTLRVSLQMTPDEKAGNEAMSSGSLVRLVGMLKPDPEQPDNLMLQTLWHRHWPRGFYVTEAFRDDMRR